MEVEGFNLQGLLMSFALITSFILVVYWLWGCSCSKEEALCRGDNCDNRTPILPKQSVIPLYAFEIEPGTVVLQSENGEVFRILREYESVGRTGVGSPPLYSSVNTRPPDQEFHYVPSYTRAHFQTRPSAPIPASAPAYDSNSSTSSANQASSSILTPMSDPWQDERSSSPVSPWTPLTATH